MEGLSRESLLAPAVGTVLISLSIVDALQRMVAVRYASKDDNGKPLFPLPFAPWVPVKDPKHEEQARKILRAFRMFENIKEWSFMCMPVMWVFSLYVGTVPKVTPMMVDISVIGSSLLFSIGNVIYAKNYIEATAQRMGGFMIRKQISLFWLVGSLVSVVCAAISKYTKSG